MANNPTKKLTILDIRKGSTLDYNFINWKATGEYNYKWGEDTYSREFMLTSRGKTVYLEIEDEEEVMEVSISKKIAVHKLRQNFPNLYQQKNIPKTAHYRGRPYHLVEEFDAEWRDRGQGGRWEGFKVWNYKGENDKDLLSVEHWDSGEWEAYTREKINKSKITNITKPKRRAFQTNWIGKHIGWIIMLVFFGFQFLICNRNTSYRSSDSQYYNSQDSTYNNSSSSGSRGIYRTSRSGSRYSGSRSRSRSGGFGK